MGLDWWGEVFSAIDTSVRRLLIPPMIQIAQIKQTTAVSALTLVYPYNRGGGTSGFFQPIATGNMLFLYVRTDGPGFPDVSLVSGATAAWAIPAGASGKGWYVRNTTGGKQNITVNLASAATFSALLCEFEGTTTIEPVLDQYISSQGPRSGTLTPTVADNLLCFFQITGTGYVPSNPTNGFILDRQGKVDDGINGLVMMYRVDSDTTAPISTWFAIAPPATQEYTLDFMPEDV